MNTKGYRYRMCVYSMVLDKYTPLFPSDDPLFDYPDKSLWELRRLIEEFRKAVEEAKKADLLAQEPDCYDPKKLQLMSRVELLEKCVNSLLDG